MVGAMTEFPTAWHKPNKHSTVWKHGYSAYHQVIYIKQKFEKYYLMGGAGGLYTGEIATPTPHRTNHFSQNKSLK